MYYIINNHLVSELLNQPLIVFFEQMQQFTKKSEFKLSADQKSANEMFKSRINSGELSGKTDIKSILRNINQYSNIDKIFVSEKETPYSKFVEGSKAHFYSEITNSAQNNDKIIDESNKTVNITGNNGETISGTKRLGGRTQGVRKLRQLGRT